MKIIYTCPRATLPTFHFDSSSGSHWRSELELNTFY